MMNLNVGAFKTLIKQKGWDIGPFEVKKTGKAIVDGYNAFYYGKKDGGLFFISVFFYKSRAVSIPEALHIDIYVDGEEKTFKVYNYNDLKAPKALIKELVQEDQRYRKDEEEMEDLVAYMESYNG